MTHHHLTCTNPPRTGAHANYPEGGSDHGYEFVAPLDEMAAGCRSMA
jgi:hypothetical protein